MSDAREETVMASPESAAMYVEALKMSGEVAPELISMQDQEDVVDELAVEFAEAQQQEEETQECPLCLDDLPPPSFLALPCGHEFCEPCFKHYISIASKAGKLELNCPNPQCKALVPGDFLQSVNKSGAARMEKNVLKERRKVDQMSNKTRNFLCGKFCLGCVRNGLCCGWTTPMDDGAAWFCYICFYGGCTVCCCCNCFFRCCGKCSRDTCPPCTDFTSWIQRDDCLPSCMMNKCWGNTVEVCPYCISIVEYAGGCPNIRCRACNKVYHRDSQCNLPCWCCAWGCYVPITYYDICGCCMSEGRCCEVGPNCWCVKM